MEATKNNTLAEQLALALLYLCSWKEKDIDTEIRRAWKGHDFSILDSLQEQELIDFSYKAKSLYITPLGILKAKEIVERLSKLADEQKNSTSE